MRKYIVIIGSIPFFEQKLFELKASGDEFNNMVTMSDAARNIGRTIELSESLILRNNHYHGIVESAHARLGGLIEDLTAANAIVYIHNPTSVLLHYLRGQYESGSCDYEEIVEPRGSFENIVGVGSKIGSIKESIVGQETALNEIAKTLWYLANARRSKPYVLMLYGGSSLGKTETAKAIAKEFFNGKMLEKHLSMFEDFSIPNYDYLFGGKPNVNSLGYELNERQSNLVFFDEMDKCGRVFHSAFYSLFDSPVYLDTTYEVDIKDLLIVLTCNYDSEEEIRKNLGDPIFFRIDKSVRYEELSPLSLLKILDLEIDKQASSLTTPIDKEEIRRMAAYEINVMGSNGRTVQSAVRAAIEKKLYDRESRDNTENCRIK